MFCCSVAKSCLTLCDPVICSTPGLPVLHYFPEFAQIHDCWVSDAIFLTISSSADPFSFFFQSFPAFPMSQFFPLGDETVGASASASESVLSMNIQGGFPLGSTGLISLHSEGLSRVFSRTTVQKHHGIQPFFFFFLNSVLTSIHDYWKTHNLDHMGLCQQSDISVF